MALQTLRFTHPVKAIQIFRKIYLYGKDEKAFSDRKEKLVWKPFDCRSGFVLNNQLYLPASIGNNVHLNNCQLITLEDGAKPYATDVMYQNQCFQKNAHIELDIFKIKWNDPMELHLNYGYFSVGLPERQNFQVAILEKEKPIEILINGKTDFSASSRRQRTFIDQHYIIELSGEFSEAILLSDHELKSTKKQLPVPAKKINLLKPLW